MTIASTADRLQAINQSISGVAAGGAPAFADYDTLKNSDGILKASLLPCVMSWAETTRLVRLGNDEYELYTDWGIWVYVGEEHQNNLITRMTTAMTLAQNFMSTYLNKAAYAVADGQFILTAGPPTIYVNQVEPITQAFSGIETVIQFAGIRHGGFRMGLQTKEEGTL